MTQSVRTLMSGLIDYAGLYPPAKLGMQEAVEAYARARMGLYEWVLGAFVCPASRLAELSERGAALMPGTFATSGYREHAEIGEPWRVSAIIDGALEAGLDAIAAFNERHSNEDRGLAEVDALELKAETPGAIDAALDAIPEDLYPFFELPVQKDCRGLIAALSGCAAAAKMRTGGTTAELFPTSRQVASFLAACAAAEVPFKATAGLHHAVRGEYPLTYEPGSARATMHGFLNLFLAAALLREHRADEAGAGAILESSDGGAFKFTEEGVRWHERFLEAAELAVAREGFAHSYGSCSFDEPIEELRTMGLL